MDDWDSGCDHVTDGGDGEPAAWCDHNTHSEPEILEQWRKSLNGHAPHYEGDTKRERLAVWRRRIGEYAHGLLKTDPEYHKARLTYEDILPPLQQEVWATINSSLFNTQWAIYRPPGGMDDEVAYALLPDILASAWRAFCEQDRNALVLGNGAAPKAVPPAKRGELAMKVKPQKVEWLWPVYIPLGKLSDIQGDPGQGKSVVTVSIAAIISSGGVWPTGEKCEPGGVIMISGEDDLADTIVPRLIAAGADLSRVYTYTLKDEILFELPRDFDLLAEKAKEIKARAIIIDPLDCFVSEEIEVNRNQSIRKLLAELARFAAEHNLAVIVVRHLNKDSKTKIAMYRGVGSIGINAASRQVFIVGPSPDDETVHVLAHVKGNCGPRPASLSYKLAGVTLNQYPDIETVQAVWGGVVDYKAWQLLADPDHAKDEDKEKPEGAKGKAASEALREILSDGAEHDSAELEAELKRQGISRDAMFKAKKKLHVKARQKGFHGGWVWFLPLETESQSPQSMEDDETPF